MKTQRITIAQAESAMVQGVGANYNLNEDWVKLIERIQPGDELAFYSDIDVFLGLCSGDKGIALLRNQKVIAKIVLAVVG
ncbi:hypothetical protein EON83_28085 [bacterium]|nr:MAG: hypothetical protein EON83_28085 [bacterium]